MSENAVTTVTLEEIDEIPLPNGSWSRMLLTENSVDGAVSSLGYSVFTPGTELDLVSHEVEEVAYVVQGLGVIRTESGDVPFSGGQAIHIQPRVWHAVVNNGEEDVIMVFGFPHPDYPPTNRK